jgi:serine protease Do
MTGPSVPDLEVTMTAKLRAMKRGIAASLVVLAACGQNGVAQGVAQDAAESARREVREQLGAVPAVVDTVTASRLSGAFRAAAERALPAVVYIQVASEPRLARDALRNNPFFWFWPRSQDDIRIQPQMGAGSGVIIDTQGHVLTNRHVVRDADEIVVRLVDGREYAADVVGTDPSTDVAVIKLATRGNERLPVAEIGDSDQLQVGDWVLALGNPLGLEFTVTAGIVSARGRTTGILGQESQYPLEAFIQTDAAINPGNSGGPLVDLHGRVVGINTAIQSPTGAYAGYGFAIPINLAYKVATDLIQYGTVRRPRLGVFIETPNEADAAAYGLERAAGAEITSVQENSPAARAGLKMGDVVIAVDGRPIETSSELQTLLAQRQPGDRVRLTIVRDRRQMDVTVELGQFETDRVRERSRSERVSAAQRLGFEARELTSRDVQELGLPADTRGVVIVDVPPLSPIYRQVSPGSVIVSINGKPIRTLRDLERAADELGPGDLVQLIVRAPQADIGERIVNYRIRR